MKMVIVADINMAEDVKVCVLGYCSEYGWEEVEVEPKPLPQKVELDMNEYYEGMADGWNACIDEIMGEPE